MRAYILIAMLCALALTAGSARADDEADETAAKVAFEEGRHHFHETGDYEAALAAFQKTQRLRPHDLVRIAIARCLEKLGRHRESVEQFVAGGLVELDVGYAAGDVGALAWSRWEQQGWFRCTLIT